jgi:hypothetical protein
MTDTAVATETNGTAPAPEVPKGQSLVGKIREEWEAAGKKLPQPEAAKKAIAAWRAAEAETQKLEAALEAARARTYDVSEKLCRMFGGSGLKVDGIVHEFSSRGDKVFLRSKGSRSNIIEV